MGFFSRVRIAWISFIFFAISTGRTLVTTSMTSEEEYYSSTCSQSKFPVFHHLYPSTGDEKKDNACETVLSIKRNGREDEELSTIKTTEETTVTDVTETTANAVTTIKNSTPVLSTIAGIDTTTVEETTTVEQTTAAEETTTVEQTTTVEETTTIEETTSVKETTTVEQTTTVEETTTLEETTTVKETTPDYSVIEVCQTWTTWGSSCYLFVSSEALTWDAAAAECLAYHHDAHLVFIGSEEENNFVVDLVGSGKYPWIGMRDVGGQWGWSRQGTSVDEEVTFTNWESNYNNRKVGEDCGYLDTSKEKWQSYDCDTGDRFICELENPWL